MKHLNDFHAAVSKSAKWKVEGQVIMPFDSELSKNIRHAIITEGVGNPITVGGHTITVVGSDCDAGPHKIRFLFHVISIK